VVKDILKSLHRHDTDYNRRKLKAFRSEWLHDKDYAPYDRGSWEQFVYDRDIKKYLD